MKPQQKLLHLPQVDTHSHENSFNVKFCLEMLKLHFAHFPLSCNICIFILSHNNCGKIYSTIKFCWFGQYLLFQHRLLVLRILLQILENLYVIFACYGDRNSYGIHIRDKAYSTFRRFTEIKNS